MIVRRATTADIPEIVRLKALLMETGWPMAVSVSGDEAWRQRCSDIADELLRRESYAAFVVPAEGPEPGEPLLGMVTINVEQHLPGPSGTGRSAYIADMSTDPGARGRGIGTALLSAALEWARDQGAGRAELYATASGRHLYERAGFSVGTSFAHLVAPLS